MLSADDKPAAHADTDTWTYCKYEHDEFTRYHYSTTLFEDKLVIFGGQGSMNISSNLILLDPATKAFKIIPSQIDKVCGYRDPSACHWKENKLILFGGENAGMSQNPCVSNVTILTLKGLESENPSADLQKVKTPIQIHRARHGAHIYEDKMYVFVGVSTSHEPSRQEVWCLDLTNFTWDQANFEGWKPIPADKDGLLELTCVFHENKAYVIPMTHFGNPELAIQEFDLDAMTCEEIKIPGSPGNRYFNKFSKQVIDGKLYAFIKTWNKETNIPKFELWTLDLSSKNWVRVETENHPLDYDSHAQLALCNNQLVYQCSNELWTLPYTKQKTPVVITKSQQVLKDLFFEAPYADISFEVDSEIIKAHKWILAKKSKYFANMFASGMSEAQASTIKITDMSLSTFKALLEFLYSDHVELDSTLALELLKQADKYSIPELQKECEAFLSKNIDQENFVLLGQTAELLEAESLKEAVVAYITKNLRKLKQRKDLNDLPEGLLKDTIYKLNSK